MPGVVSRRSARSGFAACERSGACRRGIFIGRVDVVDEAIVGKPDSVDSVDPNTPAWFCRKSAFDPDDINDSGDETITGRVQFPATGTRKVGDAVLLGRRSSSRDRRPGHPGPSSSPARGSHRHQLARPGSVAAAPRKKKARA
jgi:hypothetical protein